jgi:hypothetical protein
MLHRYQVFLDLSAEKILAYYEGRVKYVIAHDTQGARIQFPVEVLRPFVTNSGVRGKFSLFVDEKNKFVDIQRDN